MLAISIEGLVIQWQFPYWSVASAMSARLWHGCCSKPGALLLSWDDPTPVTARRMMGFADLMFDGEAILEGVTARRCRTLAQVMHSLPERGFIPVVTGELQIGWMRYRWMSCRCTVAQAIVSPPSRCDTPAMMIGLGPGHVAGVTADIAIETSRVSILVLLLRRRNLAAGRRTMRH